MTTKRKDRPAMVRLRRTSLAVALVVVSLVTAACAAGGASSPGASGITVSDAWARTSTAVAGAGAAYLTITNGGSTADALIGGSTPIADALEVHETMPMEPSPDASAGMGGGMASPGTPMMGMQKIDRLEIPAGGSVELKPGSYHLMLIGLTQELKAGETIELTLRFEQAGEVRVTAEVRTN